MASLAGPTWAPELDCNTDFKGKGNNEWEGKASERKKEGRDRGMAEWRGGRREEGREGGRKDLKS